MTKKCSYADFNDLERIRVYMEYHPEIFTDELMEYLSFYFLSYYQVRKTIKKLYPSIIKKMVKNNEIDVIPNRYEEEYQKRKKRQGHKL